MSTRKANKPEPTAEEEARGVYARRELDRETAKNEKNFKALARNKLGAKSLLRTKPAARSTPSNNTLPSSQPTTRTTTRSIPTGTYGFR